MIISKPLFALSFIGPGQTQTAVETIKMIGDTINRVDGIASEISMAVEQQGASTQKIADDLE